MEFHVDTRSKKKETLVKGMMPSIIKQLKLEKSKKTVSIKFERSCKGMGMTVPLDIIDSYVIVINPNLPMREVGLTLAHEMVHVRQMAKGILKCRNGANYWRGKKYSTKTKYLDMPWEIEAFERQELIFRRAIQ